MIVAFAPGGVTDTFARLMAQKLSENLGQQFYVDNLPGAIGYIRNGQFRALGVTTTARSEALPNTPCIADFLSGYDVSAFYGLNAPKGTPPEVIAILNKAVNAALADPAMRKKLADLGGMMLGGSPADFGKFVASETAKWGKVIKEAGIRPD